VRLLTIDSCDQLLSTGYLPAIAVFEENVLRLSVVTVGSEGDTRPLAALCRGLLDRGHEVKLFADKSTLGAPRALGVPSEPLRGDIKSILPIGDPREKFRVSEALRVGKNLKGFIANNSAAWLRTVAAHATHSDVILFSSLALGIGLILREELRKPAVGLMFQPFAPTRAFCSPGMPPMKLPGWVNWWTHKLMHRQLWGLFAESSSKARREVFGTRATMRPVYDFPVLCGVSKELVTRPADWPEKDVICGHWCNQAGDWQPPHELIDFIGAERPFYAGFGSPSAFVRAEALNALVRAVAGRRVVFSPGWSNIDRSVLPDNFFIARDVPHEWLFPRVSLAIHHGGAGTTHTAARAGVPQVILPFGSDQFFWAGRVAARGSAPKVSGRGAKNWAGLSELITFAQLGSTQQKARDLGQAVAREDGVHMAVREIEAFGLER
jgi:sterol 3beta-glucosyltransferase